MRHAIFIGGSKTPVVVQPAIYKWRPSFAHPWVVREVPDDYVASSTDDLSRYPVVEIYGGPARARKESPTTRWEGSWAQSVGAKKP